MFSAINSVLKGTREKVENYTPQKIAQKKKQYPIVLFFLISNFNSLRKIEGDINLAWLPEDWLT